VTNDEYQALVDFLGRRFTEVDTRLAQTATKEELRAQQGETRRHFEVVAEGLRGDIRQVAEGHQLLVDGQARIIERIDRLERELGAHDPVFLRGAGSEDPKLGGGDGLVAGEGCARGSAPGMRPPAADEMSKSSKPPCFSVSPVLQCGPLSRGCAATVSLSPSVPLSLFLREWSVVRGQWSCGQGPSTWKFGVRRRVFVRTAASALILVLAFL
jgi:hypothetical protein